MTDKITQALTKMFENNRIVFWYDEKKELRADFDAIEISGVNKVEIENNEFGLKYRILREQPEDKFLLFHEGPRPDDKDNWMLDLYLSYGEFRTDQIALWMAELGLGHEFTELLRENSVFFGSAARRNQLKDRLVPEDDHRDVRLKMAAVCCSTLVEPRLESILAALLREYSEGNDKKFARIERSKLSEFLFEQMKRQYGYETDNLSIADFAIELFKSCYSIELHEDAKLNQDALLFMRRWKDSIRQNDVFELLSKKCFESSDIEKDLNDRDVKKLGNIDFFEKIDKKIISELTSHVMHKTMPADQIESIISQRKSGHWFKKYENFYNTLEYALAFFERLSSINLNIENVETGIRNYAETWFRVDQLYRKTIYNYRESSQSLLKPLIDQIDNYYSNNYLMKLGDAWQHSIEHLSDWKFPGVPQQHRFFAKNVQPFLSANKKVAVIISDAMRYEVGEELFSRVQQENRYVATLKFQQSPLPSYTQLGMAALLPHKELSIDDNDKGTVSADGVSTSGTANRAKILNSAIAGGATAVKAADFNSMGGEASRELIKSHDVVYIYHNQIDHTGDNRESEERVFNAVEDTINELIFLVRRLASANVNNLIITADHGFIYQNNELDESDFVGSEQGDPNIRYRDRRFLLGKGLADKEFAVNYTSEQLGLAGSMEVQIPRSINRLRLKGSGSRFVHGGSSLQEIVVPVISINKKRKDNIEYVDVDILRGSTSIITSRQFSVVLFQEQVVEDKIQPRSLRVAVYSTKGDLLSDVRDMCFDNTTEEHQGREYNVQFVLSAEAEKFSGQEIVLKLEEREGKTSHYKEYKSARYTLRLNAGFGFDF